MKEFFVLSCALWALRLINEALVFPAPWVEHLWLVVLRPLALFALGYRFALVYARFYNDLNRKRFWQKSFIAASIFCIPYVPDMYASFVKAGEKNAFILSLAFYTLGILTYGVIRGISCIFVSKYLVPGSDLSRKRIVSTYLSFLVFEFMFFHSWHPITYFPALPLPIPSARFETSPGRSPVKYILFESHIDGQMRQALSRGGFVALTILGEKLASEVRVNLKQHSLTKSVVLILPETFVELESIDDARLLIEPVAATLRDEFKLENMVWIQGASLKSNNIVIGSEVELQSTIGLGRDISDSQMSIIRLKREHMPMFEAASKGISYSATPQDQNFSEEQPPKLQNHLVEFLNRHQILICYESLFPQNWKFTKSTLVLTNHHLFNEYRLMNWVYLGFLRQFAFLFGSETLVVSNFNDSGVMRPLSSSLWDSGKLTEGWTTVKLR